MTTLFPRRLRVLSMTLAIAATLLPAMVPAALAAAGLSLTTPYPAVTVTPGTTVSLDLTVDANEKARVELTLNGVPAMAASICGWNWLLNQNASWALGMLCSPRSAPGAAIAPRVTAKM